MIYSARHLIRDTENAQVETAGPGSVYLCLSVLFVFAASYGEIVTDATVQVDFALTTTTSDCRGGQIMMTMTTMMNTCDPRTLLFIFFQISKSNRF